MRTAVTGRPVSAAPKASDRIARSGSSGTRPIVSATTPVLDSRGPKLGDCRRPNRPTPPEGRTARTAPGPRTWIPTTARARLGRRSRSRAESRPGAGTLDGRAAAADHPGARGAGRVGGGTRGSDDGRSGNRSGRGERGDRSRGGIRGGGTRGGRRRGGARRGSGGGRSGLGRARRGRARGGSRRGGAGRGRAGRRGRLRGARRGSSRRRRGRRGARGGGGRGRGRIG